jgi:hypothetical protein
VPVTKNRLKDVPDALSDAFRDFACSFGRSLRYVLTGGQTAFAATPSRIQRLSHFSARSLMEGELS